MESNRATTHSLHLLIKIAWIYDSPALVIRQCNHQKAARHWSSFICFDYMHNFMVFRDKLISSSFFFNTRSEVINCKSDNLWFGETDTCGEILCEIRYVGLWDYWYVFFCFDFSIWQEVNAKFVFFFFLVNTLPFSGYTIDSACFQLFLQPLLLFALNFSLNR